MRFFYIPIFYGHIECAIVTQENNKQKKNRRKIPTTPIKKTG